MEKNSGLHLLYKNLGETPNERILRFKKDNPEFESVSMTYAGRLDPMAEGLLLVVSGEEIKEKDKYLDLKKTYEVEVLWGFETDTLDVLGKVLDVENSFSTYSSEDTDIFLLKNSSSSLRRASLVPPQNMISTNFLVGKFKQKYPAYSSKPVNGKPLFQWAREGKLGEVEIPSHIVEIFDCNFLTRSTISKSELLSSLKSKIESVKGDFRQKEIFEKWAEVLQKVDNEEFVVDRIKMRVSSGFYVRQFVTDLAKGLGAVATTFHIKRAKIGDYLLADSVK